MFDLGLSKMALIGVVALIVIGPEKLPRVARTVGTLLGKAQRYVADVKAEVNRAMDVEELKKMKAAVEDTAREVERSISEGARQFEQGIGDIGADLSAAAGEGGFTPAGNPGSLDPLGGWQPPVPEDRHPNKNWRLKRGATPRWYKARQGVRTQVQSGAARVARFRPKGR